MKTIPFTAQVSWKQHHRLTCSPEKKIIFMRQASAPCLMVTHDPSPPPTPTPKFNWLSISPTKLSNPPTYLVQGFWDFDWDCKSFLNCFRIAFCWFSCYWVQSRLFVVLLFLCFWFCFLFFLEFYTGHIQINYDSYATHSPTHSLTHSRTHSLTHSRTHSRTHSLTHALTHSLTQSINQSVSQSTKESITKNFELCAPRLPWLLSRGRRHHKRCRRFLHSKTSTQNFLYKALPQT